MGQSAISVCLPTHDLSCILLPKYSIWTTECDSADVVQVSQKKKVDTLNLLTHYSQAQPKLHHLSLSK